MPVKPGTFELEAFLKDPGGSLKSPVMWDLNAVGPVILWISSPAKSGIAFIDKAHLERPFHHLLVNFPPPEEKTSNTIGAKINYTLNPDTKAGQHVFWLDVIAELTTADGRRIHDMGVVKLPFSVDTHLKTKLLMLLVVAAAVFLFIVVVGARGCGGHTDDGIASRVGIAQCP